MIKHVMKVAAVACLGVAMLAAPTAIFAAGNAVPSSMVSIGGDEGALEPEVELKIGDQAPGFSLPNLASDKMESLKDYLGKPIVLFFIQSACYSCLQEAKALKSLKDKYPQIEVIAVGVDLLGKPMLVSWAAHNDINYPVLLDPIFSVPEKYGFSFTPSSVIIDKNGKVVFIHAGYRPQDVREFESKINELLGK